MKKINNIIGIVGLSAIILCAALAPNWVKAQSNMNRYRPAVVILGYDQVLGAPIITDWGSYRPQIGLAVTWVSRSGDAPIIQINTDLAEASATLLTYGFHAERRTTYGEWIFTRN